MLPKTERLRKEKEIKAVLRKREIEAGSPLLYLTAVETKHPKTRLAVITSKKLGKAVVRNRIRRLIVEAYKKIKHKIGKNWDIVIIPKPKIAQARFINTIAGLEKALTKAGLC